MIVECSECQTRFQLDDARIPAAGIRVRCSRCKHAFFLKPPTESGPSDAIHEVAQEAAISGQVPPPGTTQDLPGPTPAASAEQAEESEESEESDWEFNEEVPDPADIDDPEPGLVGGNDSSIALDDSSGSGLAEQDFGVDHLEHDDLAQPGNDVGTGIDLAGDGLDQSILDEPSVDEVEVASRSESAESIASSDETSGSDDTFGSVDELGDLGGGTSESSAPEVAAGERLDDPEDWDFFGDEGPPPSDFTDSAGPLASASLPEHLGQHQKVTLGRIGEPAGLDSLPVHGSEASALGPWLRGTGHAVGWALTLGLLGVGLMSGLRASWQPAVVGEPVVLASGLRPAALEAHWVDSARSGPLLVVSGEIHGPSAGPAVAVGGLEVALLDFAGNALESPGIAVGTPLPDVVLRERDRTALDQTRVAAADALARTRVGPGQRVQFEAVVSDVPIEAQRFDLRSRPLGVASDQTVGSTEAAATSVESAEAPGGEGPDGIGSTGDPVTTGAPTAGDLPR